VQIAAVVALGAGITLGTTAVLANDGAATETETPAPQVVYEWPEHAGDPAPEAEPVQPGPAEARTAGIDWQ
jgi:hypothetical protein